MLLKLVMPYKHRSMQGATIVKWHKHEREWVANGDALCDVKVEERTIIKPPPPLRQLIELLTDPQFALRLEQAGDQATDQRNAPEPQYTKVKRPGRLLCIKSSDTGFLRQIRGREGEYCEVGRLLALLTTEENEPFAEEDLALAGAGVFRVVADPVGSMREKLP